MFSLFIPSESKNKIFSVEFSFSIGELQKKIPFLFPSDELNVDFNLNPLISFELTKLLLILIFFLFFEFINKSIKKLFPVFSFPKINTIIKSSFIFFITCNASSFKTNLSLLNSIKFKADGLSDLGGGNLDILKIVFSELI